MTECKTRDPANRRLKILGNIKIYNSLNDSWIAGPTLNKGTYYHSYFELKEEHCITRYLLVIGYCNILKLNSIEIVNITDVVWKFGAKLVVGLYKHWLVKTHKSIYSELSAFLLKKKYYIKVIAFNNLLFNHNDGNISNIK